MEKKRTGSLIKRETDRTEQNITEKWKKRRRRRRPFVLTIRRGSPSPRAASGSARSRTCPAAAAARCTSSSCRWFVASPPLLLQAPLQAALFLPCCARQWTKIDQAGEALLIHENAPRFVVNAARHPPGRFRRVLWLHHKSCDKNRICVLSYN